MSSSELGVYEPGGGVAHLVNEGIAETLRPVQHLGGQFDAGGSNAIAFRVLYEAVRCCTESLRL